MKKYDPVSGKDVEYSDNSAPICRGFFNAEKDINKIKLPKKGNYAILIDGENSTTYQFDGDERVDAGYLYMPTGKPGKDGETPVGIDKVEIIKGELVITYSDAREVNLGYIKGENSIQITAQDIIGDLLNNDEFISKTKGKDGNGKDGVAPTIQDVVKNLLSNQEFLSKTKGKDGEDGKTPTINLDYIAGLLKQDDGFISKVEGKPGKSGKDAVVDTKSLAFDLKNDKEFIELTKGKDGVGKDGTSVTVEDVIQGLKSNKEFIDMVKGKDGEDSKITIEDIVKVLKKDFDFQEKIKGKDGVGYPGNPGKDGESITVGFSPDGVKDITADFKEGDKFMYVRVGLRKPNVFQIIK